MNIARRGEGNCFFQKRLLIGFSGLYHVDVINKLIPEMVAGKRVVELCTLGDQLIDAGVAGIYNNPKKKVESKGVAFPTSIAVNHCVGHFSPLKDDTTVLKDGDIVKMLVKKFF